MVVIILELLKQLVIVQICLISAVVLVDGIVINEPTALDVSAAGAGVGGGVLVAAALLRSCSFATSQWYER